VPIVLTGCLVFGAQPSIIRIKEKKAKKTKELKP
jgi:hypothetical protein